MALIILCTYRLHIATFVSVFPSESLLSLPGAVQCNPPLSILTHWAKIDIYRNVDDDGVGGSWFPVTLFCLFAVSSTVVMQEADGRQARNTFRIRARKCCVCLLYVHSGTWTIMSRWNKLLSVRKNALDQVPDSRLILPKCSSPRGK